jgi:hypothetical protein
MRKFILLIFINISIVSYSQIIKKEVVYKIISESEKRDLIDTALCDRNYQSAINDIDRNNLLYLTSAHLRYFDYYQDTVASYYFKKTEWLWIKEHTCFTEERKWYAEDSLKFSDDKTLESLCYDVVFFHYKNSIYGENFSSEVKRKADSLRTIGMDYIPIKINQKQIDKLIAKESKYKVDFKNFDDIFYTSTKAIRADVIIGQNGEIISIVCWHTSMGGLISRSINTDNEYVEEVNRIVRMLPSFIPSKYRKKV